MRAAAASEVYIATSDAFMDVPNDADERARLLATGADLFVDKPVRDLKKLERDFIDAMKGWW